MPIPRHSLNRKHRQSGAGATGFLLASVPVLMLGLGAIEIGHGFKVRQVVNLALLEAARAGSTGHAHPDAIQHAFESALLPLFRGTTTAQRATSRDGAFQARENLTGRVPWRIQVLSPSTAHFQAYHQPHLRIARETGLQTINNNYLAEQVAIGQEAANPPLSPAATNTAFHANVLALRVHYLYRPMLPGVAQMLRMFGHRHGSYARHALSHGFLPLQQELAVIMQSHPVRWPMPPQGKVVRAGETHDDHAGEPLPGLDTCHGLWCVKGSSARTDNGYTAPTDATGESWLPPAGSPPVAPATPENQPGADSLIDPTDPACGVSLCCIG